MFKSKYFSQQEIEKLLINSSAISGLDIIFDQPKKQKKHKFNPNKTLLRNHDYQKWLSTSQKPIVQHLESIDDRH